MQNNQTQRDTISRLALCCSALARSGQILSTVTGPAQARTALRQAATHLDEDPRLAGLANLAELAAECRSAAEAPDDAGLVAVCRQLAARLARQASSVATEVQGQSRKVVKPAVEPMPAAPVAAEEVVVAEPAPAAAVAAEGAVVAEPVPAAPAPLPPGYQYVTVARTPEEQSVVVAVLKGGKRFAIVANGTVIDTETNLMWAAKVGPPANYAAASRYAAACGLGGYADWRLPRPEELRSLLTGSGRDFARTSRMLIAEGSGAEAEQLWSGEFQWRWLILWREVVIMSVRNAETAIRRAGAVGPCPLPVRSAA
jgi:hypothetical protein